MPLARLSAGKGGQTVGEIPESASRETCQRLTTEPANGVFRYGQASRLAFWSGLLFGTPSPNTLMCTSGCEAGMTMTATLYVCMTCKAGAPVPEGELPPGAQLHAALVARETPKDVQIVAVECLSACTQGCAVALQAPGKWAYVYGRLTGADADDVLVGAAAYAATTDGLVPWRERPVIFRKQSLARIPPLLNPSLPTTPHGELT
jgi:predicted metal-binding protein